MRRAAALLAALALAGAAAAQSVGDPAETFLDAVGAAPAPQEGRWLAGGVILEPRTAQELLTGLTLEVTLDEEGVAEAASLLAIATGYGAGIEEPIAGFLTGRAAELAHAGEVTVALESFALHVDVRGDPPHDATLRLELPRVEDDAFGAPVATLGPDDAAVVVREFSDFQCPYCRRYARQVLPGLKEGLLATGDVRFEFHHLPLESIHANAAPAAEAAQCVADVYGDDAFWAYHDLLFERQQAWQGLSDAEPYLARLSGDLPTAVVGEEAAPRERVGACLASGDAAAAVDAAVARARALQLSGTPSVFVGGYRVQNFGDPAAYARFVRLERAGAGAGDGD